MRSGGDSTGSGGGTRSSPGTSSSVRPEPCSPGNDLWLSDGRLVLFHWFTGDGEWAGHEFNEDSVTVKMVIASFEAVQDRAIPHEEFTI
ncbi:DUF6879 family protein [Streptomyces roseolus]|uniref:DUF6879 family protein n=1 Tax=Streptomyces roseolus TaxID=67358 RepID=UPI0037A29379